jgi:putative phage-type endonuclease
MGLFKRANTSPVLVKTPKYPSTEYPYYENTELEQGTDEWRSWRKGVIGASEAPTVMRENRWSSPEYLLDEKLGIKKEFQGNDVTREGHLLEIEARNLLIRNFKVELKPTIVQDGKIPYLAASLDAITTSHSQVFEIKCGARAYSMVEEKGVIPSYYKGQLQHILMITQLDIITYVAYRPFSKLITLDVERDDAYIERMRSAEIDFAELLLSKGHKMQKKFVGNPIDRLGNSDS